MNSLEIINKLDWNDMKFLLVFSRLTSYSATAKKLNVNRTTVSRHLRGLEELLEAKLFVKKDDTYELTKQGQVLIPYAENMEKVLLSMQSSECLSNVGVNGMVKLSLPSGMDTGACAYNFPELLEEHDGLQIDLVSNEAGLDINKREIDLKVTFCRPSNEDLVVKRLADFKMGLFASKDYLRKKGEVRSFKDLANHVLISQPHKKDCQSALDIQEISRFCKKSTLVSSNLKVRFEAMLNGYGLCVVPYFMAKQVDSIVQVLPEEADWLGQLWLVMQEDLRSVPRIRTVTDFLTQQSHNMQGLLVDQPYKKEQKITFVKRKADFAFAYAQ